LQKAGEHVPTAWQVLKMPMIITANHGLFLATGHLWSNITPGKMVVVYANAQTIVRAIGQTILNVPAIILQGVFACMLRLLRLCPSSEPACDF